jgi:hypothetical protein
MQFANGRFLVLAALAAAATGLVTGCGSDSSTGPSKPSAPANLKVEQLSLTSVRVSWDAVSGATRYVLERAVEPSLTSYTDVGGSNLTATTFDDNGLTAGAQYSYRISAVVGTQTSDASAAISVRTGAKEATLSGNITASRTLDADSPTWHQDRR